MRKSCIHLTWIVCLLFATSVIAAPADSPEPVVAKAETLKTVAEPLAEGEVREIDCATELPPLTGELMWVNLENGPSDPADRQVSCGRCNCTKSGTSVPPGQLGIKCASPIGGPPVSCRNVCCFTSTSTPWINGVCG